MRPAVSKSHATNHVTMNTRVSVGALVCLALVGVFVYVSILKTETSYQPDRNKAKLSVNTLYVSDASTLSTLPAVENEK